MFTAKITHSGSSRRFKCHSFQAKSGQTSRSLKIDLHRQTGEVVFRDLMKSTASVNRLHALTKRVERQLKNERTINRARQTQINSLQEKIVALS